MIRSEKAVKRPWKTMVFAAGLFASLVCTAVPRAYGVETPTNAFDHWTNQTATALSHQPDADSLVTAAAMQTMPDRALLKLLDKAERLDPSAADIAAFAMLKCAWVSDCDSLARARHLQALAPDNALAWLPDLRAAREQKDPQQVTRILQRMAQAERLDTYQPTLAHRILDGLDRVSPPPSAGGLNDLAGDSARTLQAEALVHLLPFADYRDLMLSCHPDRAEFSVRKAACRQVADKLTQSSLLVSNMVGDSLQRWSARDPQDYQQALTFGRQVDWLMSIRGSCNQATITTCVGADMKATSELDASRTIARQLGRSVTPPAHWVDKAQRARIARDEQAFHLAPGSHRSHADGKTSTDTAPAMARVTHPKR